MRGILRIINRTPKHIQYTTVNVLAPQSAQFVIHLLGVLSRQITDPAVSKPYQGTGKALTDTRDDLQVHIYRNVMIRCLRHYFFFFL